MGWSIDNKTALIERIFRKLGKRVKVSRPEATYPQVYIAYEGKPVPLKTLDELIALFPDNVCVHFIPNSPFEVKVEPTASDARATS